MTQLAQLSWDHDPSCSGCPGCDPLYARMLGSTPEELGRILRERDRGLKGPGSGRVLRVAANGGRAGGCHCGAGQGDGRQAKIDTILAAAPGVDEAALRGLSDNELVEAVAEVVLLTHPPDPYRLKAAGGDTRTDEEVYLSPPDPYAAALNRGVR